MKKLLNSISMITLSLTLLFSTFFIPIQTLASTTTSSTPTINRLAGFDRYETASKIAKNGWLQSDYVILAYGENYPDALSASPLAKKYDAPILLTTSNNLPPTTKQTLIDLQTKNVIIIGGTGVISSSIDTELQSMNINVTRIFGNDKYETSIKIAEQITTTPSSIFACTGEDYSDALSVSPIASLKQIPIILVPNDTMPDSIKNYINSNSTNITKSYVIGFSDVINDNIANQFPNNERILGSDKYSRNIAINQKFNSIFDINHICLSTGEQFADALTGSAYASKISSPIILVNFNSPIDTKSYYQQRLVNSTNPNITIFGGTSVVPDSVIDGLNTLPSIPIDTQLSPTEISQQVSPSVVYIEVFDQYNNKFSSGSGLILESNGKILTNYHVVKGGANCKVQLSDGRIFQLDEIYYKDENRDIFIFGVEATNLPTVKIGDSNLINVGDKIYTIGSPRGLENTLSDGLISSKSRVIDNQTYIQISAPISAGSSGGALVDSQGNIIGITTAKIKDGENLNFCIPVNEIKPFLSVDNNILLPTIPVLPTLPTTPPSQPIQMNDVDFQNYLNQNYGTLTINGESVKFSWMVNKFTVSPIDNSIVAMINTSDYITWLSWVLSGNSKSQINNWGNELNAVVANNYPNESFIGNIVYQDFYTFYPTTYEPNEISYSSTDHKWRVTHTILGFGDMKMFGKSNPIVLIK